MKRLTKYLYESCIAEATDAEVDALKKKLDKVEKKADDADKKATDADKEVNKADESIKSEKDFREAARAKFEEVFGDDLDEKKMNDTIKGLLKDNKDLVDKGDWGSLIGILNNSFGD